MLASNYGWSATRSTLQFELERLLESLIRRITGTLVRAGVLVEDPEYPWLDIYIGTDGAALGGIVQMNVPVGKSSNHYSSAQW